MKQMTEKQAWQYLERKFRRCDETGYITTSDGFSTRFLCDAVKRLAIAGRIADSVSQSMLDKINRALRGHVVLFYPVSRESGHKRADFCKARHSRMK